MIFSNVPESEQDIMTFKLATFQSSSDYLLSSGIALTLRFLVPVALVVRLSSQAAVQRWETRK